MGPLVILECFECSWAGLFGSGNDRVEVWMTRVDRKGCSYESYEWNVKITPHM